MSVWRCVWSVLFVTCDTWTTAETVASVRELFADAAEKVPANLPEPMERRERPYPTERAELVQMFAVSENRREIHGPTQHEFSPIDCALMATFVNFAEGHQMEAVRLWAAFRDSGFSWSEFCDSFSRVVERERFFPFECHNTGRVFLTYCDALEPNVSSVSALHAIGAAAESSLFSHSRQAVRA